MIVGAFGQDGVPLSRALSTTDQKLLLVGRDRHICTFKGNMTDYIITKKHAAVSL